MQNRIKQHAPNLPEYFTLQECLDKEITSYEGAGFAFIATAADKILDLEYFDGMKQAERFYNDAKASGADVWAGFCSCYSFCEPVKLSTDSKAAFNQILEILGNQNG